jgi:putative NIF3 family GTP cyclohydrolase 1 type 2
MGNEKTNPAIGEKLKTETVNETRLEMVVSANVLDLVIGAMRKAHPYEEPAFDVVPLVGASTTGQGRIGELEATVDRSVVIKRIAKGLGLKSLLVAGPKKGKISRVACVAGAGGEFLKDAIEQKAQLYLTGEMRHHDALKAADRGATVVCALHSNSERASLKKMARLLKQRVEVNLSLSKRDRDPFEVAG